jgi:hypothetical protein
MADHRAWSRQRALGTSVVMRPGCPHWLRSCPGGRPVCWAFPQMVARMAVSICFHCVDAKAARQQPLRHGFAVNHLESGKAPLNAVQRALGQLFITSTSVYIQLTTPRRQIGSPFHFRRPRYSAQVRGPWWRFGESGTERGSSSRANFSCVRSSSRSFRRTIVGSTP